MDEPISADNPVTTRDPFQENTEGRLMRAEAVVARVESRLFAPTSWSGRLRRHQTTLAAGAALLLLAAAAGTLVSRRRRQRRIGARIDRLQRAASRLIAGRR
jgi:hypothetical protein